MINDIYEHLKFRLDDEHQDFEFEIISVPPYEFIENNLSLVSYEYFGEINEILGSKVKQVLLYFNADRLMRVELKYKENKVESLKNKLEEFTVSFPSSVTLKLYYQQEDNLTILMYQKEVLNRFYDFGVKKA
ncbi:hypothetical protein C1637_10035 [Chryseobacterium lactis]|jgi:hypothetical protein|uniref:Uncharacterized protein n=2 Tax=Chryseobacterium TaxID=59732 RepID=A0A3G6RBU9_CHRLC|nr:hypothetical protein [Chryseobacterium lactis]AZA82150.1 hypothetical protein EG342_09660 [Chryseobacterium lactis]AZB02531.1 hypothetical protein EG341_00515 [Chryseobacterium lactis]PNW14173.1 hypothetical protein C1637_10035 [Chryseobacterium lactis]